MMVLRERLQLRAPKLPHCMDAFIHLVVSIIVSAILCTAYYTQTATCVVPGTDGLERKGSNTGHLNLPHCMDSCMPFLSVQERGDYLSPPPLGREARMGDYGVSFYLRSVCVVRFYYSWLWLYTIINSKLRPALLFIAANPKCSSCDSYK